MDTKEHESMMVGRVTPCAPFPLAIPIAKNRFRKPNPPPAPPRRGAGLGDGAALGSLFPSLEGLGVGFFNSQKAPYYKIYLSNFLKLNSKKHKNYEEYFTNYIFINHKFFT